MFDLFKKKSPISENPVGTEFVFNISDIRVPAKFNNTKPKDWKLDLVAEHCKEIGRLDYPVIVHKASGKYYVRDNYTRFLVARDVLKLKKIPVMIQEYSHWVTD